MTTARRTDFYENSLFCQLSTAGTIFLNTYEIVRLLVVSNVFFYKLNFQQAEFHYITSTVHDGYQLYTPV